MVCSVMCNMIDFTLPQHKTAILIKVTIITIKVHQPLINAILEADLKILVMN